MVNKNNIIFYAAIVLFIVYYLQGIVYPSGNFQSQICLTLYLLIGSYCAFHSLFLERANTLTYTWGTFILMLSFTFLLSPKIVHGTVNEAIGDISTFSQFKESFLFLWHILLPVMLAGMELSLTSIYFFLEYYFSF